MARPIQRMRLRPSASESGPHSSCPAPKPMKKTVITGATAFESAVQPEARAHLPEGRQHHVDGQRGQGHQHRDEHDELDACPSGPRAGRRSRVKKASPAGSSVAREAGSPTALARVCARTPGSPTCRKSCLRRPTGRVTPAREPPRGRAACPPSGVPRGPRAGSWSRARAAGCGCRHRRRWWGWAPSRWSRPARMASVIISTSNSNPASSLSSRCGSSGRATRR